MRGSEEPHEPVDDRLEEAHRAVRGGEGAAWAATSSETARKVAKSVQDHPGTDRKSVCEALGLRNRAASTHLGHFEHLGLVSSHFEARHRIYAPTPELQTLVAATVA